MDETDCPLGPFRPFRPLSPLGPFQRKMHMKKTINNNFYFLPLLLAATMVICWNDNLFADSIDPSISPVQPVEPPLVEPPVEIDQESNRFFMEFVRMMSILGIVIVGLMFLSWYLKRFMNSRIEQMNSTSLIKVVERRDLTAKTVLYILEINDQQILIAETHNGVTALGELHPNRRERSSFSQILEGESPS